MKDLAQKSCVHGDGLCEERLGAWCWTQLIPAVSTLAPPHTRQAWAHHQSQWCLWENIFEEGPKAVRSEGRSMRNSPGSIAGPARGEGGKEVFSLYRHDSLLRKALRCQQHWREPACLSRHLPHQPPPPRQQERL